MSKGYSVWCGDILTFAHYFQVARVEQNQKPTFRELCKVLKINSPKEVVDILNKVRVIDGWFVEEYAEKRRFFTKENAQRIESCWHYITQWSKNGWLSDSEHAILLASLINSMDKVANTAGTYYAHLKVWHRKSTLPFHFEIIPYTPGISDCQCFLVEAKNLVTLRSYDILYLDPPYNQRCYSSYYHLPETIALEKTPSIHGKSGIPNNLRSTSDFNKRSQARGALIELLEKAQFRLLAFHYSDSGLITPKEVRQIFDSYGRTSEFILDSKGYTTAKTKRMVEHRLYLVCHD